MPVSGIIATKEDVEAFRDSCVLLRSEWVHFTTLFEGTELKRELLQTTAPTLFRDLHRLFVEHLVLHICRLTDNAQTMGRKNSLSNSWLSIDDAYCKLKEAIRENEFPPGYQGSEQEIAARLGMSRTPVHEAVIRLQEEGLVRVLPRRGVVVRSISAEDMREIYEVIIALETGAAELLSEPNTPR